LDDFFEKMVPFKNERWDLFSVPRTESYWSDENLKTVVLEIEKEILQEFQSETSVDGIRMSLSTKITDSYQ